MELPDYVRRADKSPPPSAPTGGALSGAEHDHNLDETERALSELDTEKLGIDAAQEIETTLSSVADDDEFVVYDTSAAGVAKVTTAAAIRAPLVERLDDIDDLLVGLEAAIEAIL